jgi:hypothetical protein
MVRRFELRDDQWERIKELLPGREGICPRADKPAAEVEQINSFVGKSPANIS